MAYELEKIESEFKKVREAIEALQKPGHFERIGRMADALPAYDPELEAEIDRLESQRPKTKTEPLVCGKCAGSGWVWWDELDEYYGPAEETGCDDTRYSCDWCKKQPTEEESLEPKEPDYRALCLEARQIISFVKEHDINTYEAGLLPLGMRRKIQKFLDKIQELEAG